MAEGVLKNIIIFAETTRRIIRLGRRHYDFAVAKDCDSASIPEFRDCQRSLPTPPYWPKYGGDCHVELIDGLWSAAKLGSIEEPPVSSIRWIQVLIHLR
jgi:hypothetical protein